MNRLNKVYGGVGTVHPAGACVRIRLDGNVSVTVIPVASSAPVFFTMTVYVTVSPGSRSVSSLPFPRGSSVFVIEISAGTWGGSGHRSGVHDSRFDITVPMHSVARTSVHRFNGFGSVEQHTTGSGGGGVPHACGLHTSPFPFLPGGCCLASQSFRGSSVHELSGAQQVVGVTLKKSRHMDSLH